MPLPRHTGSGSRGATTVPANRTPPPAVVPAAAADTENSIPRLHGHGFDQGPRPVVEAAVGECPRPRQEAQRRAIADPRLEGHLVPPPWPFPFAVAPEHRSLAGFG